MASSYDKHYQTENLFGQAYPALIDFFAGCSSRGKLLDLGCGQGRDSLPLARLGFDVTGVDNSKVGIDQMLRLATSENLKLKGMVADLFEFEHYHEFDFVLLDSMFHFEKKERKQETELIKKIITQVKDGCLVVVCIQDTGEKVKILNQAIDFKVQLERVTEQEFVFAFEDKENGHRSETNYRMVVVRK